MKIVLNIKEFDFERMRRVAEYWLGRIKKQSRYTVSLKDSQVIVFLLGVAFEILEPKMKQERRERNKRARERYRKKTEKD